MGSLVHNALLTEPCAWLRVPVKPPSITVSLFEDLCTDGYMKTHLETSDSSLGVNQDLSSFYTQQSGFVALYLLGMLPVHLLVNLDQIILLKEA